MGGFDGLVRDVVGVSREVFDSLHSTVSYRQWDGTLDGFGTPGHLPAVPRKCISLKVQKLVRTLQKTEEMSDTRLVFLEPMNLSKYDEFAEAGAVAFRPIMSFNGFVDPATVPGGGTFYGDVYL